jgi:hypothetical protein
MKIERLAGILERLITKKEHYIKREWSDWLPGDIKKFDVDNSLICEELSMSFKPFKVGKYML